MSRFVRISLAVGMAMILSSPFILKLAHDTGAEARLLAKPVVVESEPKYRFEARVVGVVPGRSSDVIYIFTDTQTGQEYVGLNKDSGNSSTFLTPIPSK